MLGDRGLRVVGFLVAGGALIALADVAPDAAIGLAAVVGLGVLLTHGAEITQISNAFQMAAPGHITAGHEDLSTPSEHFSGISAGR